MCVTCGSFGIHTACSSDLNDVDDQEEFEYECPDCQKVTKNKTESAITRNEPAITRNEPVITRNEPAITRSEPVITKNEPSIERNQPVIATCDPPSSPSFNPLSSPPSVRFDDSNGSSNSTNKQEIELIEISDDEEDEEEIICVEDEDEEDMFKPFSGGSLTGQKSHTKGFNKYRSHCFSQN